MQKGIAVALLVGGAALLFWGFSVSESFSSDISRVFTGSPTDKAMWLMIGGGAAILVGGFTMFRGFRSTA